MEKSIFSDDYALFLQRLRDTRKSTATKSIRTNKSDSAKDAQIARLKERVRTLEEQVRLLKDENELLYGKLSHSSLAHALPLQSAG